MVNNIIITVLYTLLAGDNAKERTHPLTYVHILHQYREQLTTLSYTLIKFSDMRANKLPSKFHLECTDSTTQ